MRGEAQTQGVLEQIAGSKHPEGKQTRVGITLRCEPDNPYDVNAVRVEIMGQRVGYIARETALKLAARLTSSGSAVECHGMIVGGWKDTDTEGHFGVRVWLSSQDAK